MVLLILALAGDLPRDLSAEVFRWERPHSGLALSLGVEADARVSLPIGVLGEDRIVTPGGTLTNSDHLLYSGLFHPGLGVALEASLLFGPDRPRGAEPRLSDNPSLGPYAAIHWDRFGGASEEDDLGTTIEPDAMEVTTIFGGVKGEGVIQGPFYGSLRVGLGAVHYESVRARFSPAASPEFSGEMISDSWTAAMEMRLHFGWRAGPLGLSFGFGFRMMGGPQDGAAMDFESGILFLLDFDIGAELRF